MGDTLQQVTHIVCFKYKDTVTASERTIVHERFMALQDECITQTGVRYITSITGGENDSPEALAKGFHVRLSRLFCCVARLAHEVTARLCRQDGSRGIHSRATRAKLD